MPLGTHILALADSLDAMCSDRPYRATPTFDEVKAKIQRCSGKHFDPAVVAAFNALAAEKSPEYFANSAKKVDESAQDVAAMRANRLGRYLKRGTLMAELSKPVAGAQPAER